MAVSIGTRVKSGRSSKIEDGVRKIKAKMMIQMTSYGRDPRSKDQSRYFFIHLPREEPGDRYDRPVGPTLREGCDSSLSRFQDEPPSLTTTPSRISISRSVKLTSSGL